MATGVATTISRGRSKERRLRITAWPGTSPACSVLTTVVKPASRHSAKRSSPPSRSSAAVSQVEVPGRSSGPHDWGGASPCSPPPPKPAEAPETARRLGAVPEGGERVEEAGVDGLAGAVDDPCAGGRIDVAADRGDDAVVDDHGGAFQGGARDRDDACVLDGEEAHAVGPGGARLGVQRQGGRREEGGEEGDDGG